MVQRGLSRGFSLEIMGLPQKHPSFHDKVNKLASLRSSEWAAVWGLSPYMSRIQLWRVIKGQEERKKLSPHIPALAHGNREEPKSADFFEKIYLKPSQDLQEFGAMQLFDDPRYSASPDRLIVEYGRMVSGLEIKNPSSKKIPSKVAPQFYEELSHRVLQCFLCMAIFDVPSWHLLYTKFNTQESSLFLVHWNKKFWEDRLYPLSKEFMESTQPPPDRMPTKEKKKNAEWIMTNIKVDHLDYRPPVCEED